MDSYLAELKKINHRQPSIAIAKIKYQVNIWIHSENVCHRCSPFAKSEGKILYDELTAIDINPGKTNQIL